MDAPSEPFPHRTDPVTEPWPTEGAEADPSPGEHHQADIRKGSSIDRRRFLALAGGAGTAAALAAVFGPRAWDALFGGGGTESTAGSKLVLVTLYGGNDGLNTVVPVGDPAYASARGPLALDRSSVLPLADGFGLHPSLPGMKKQWDANRLAIVHGVGFPDPNYSHFESMDIWQSGSTSSVGSTGWIGRWLDASSSNPLRALGIGPTMPIVLSGESVQGATVPTGPIRLPGGDDSTPLYRALTGISPGEAELLGKVAQSNASLLAADRELGPILDRASTSPMTKSAKGAGASEGSLAAADGGGGQTGGGVLAVQLSTVANLILGGATTDVYSVELGGFDTHSDQAATQKTLLGEVDTAVSSFVDTVGSSPRGRGTVVLIYTEFGRRMEANASAGTDHGWANVALVTGPGIKGGFYGRPPSLTKLSDGNVVFTTDFRSLYATALEAVLGFGSRRILDGSYPMLPLI